MHLFIQRLTALFSVIALAVALVSCGGGSGGGSTDADQVQGKGTVGILLTDMPADPAMFSSIFARILKVELMPADDNGRITLYSAPPTKEFDLLRLRNESIPLAFKDNVPAGKYCKIRLTLEELELVLVDGTLEYPHLPGNGKLDLVARDCFNVVDGQMLTLQLDFDAGKSIHIIEKPNCLNNPKKSCFNFRPVVFVDVISHDFDSKLVRLDGVITAVNSDQQTLLLCDALPNQGMDNLGCVKVYFGPDSAFFDSNSPWYGVPRAIDDLLATDDYLKEGLSVVGWVRSWTKTDNDDDKPAEYYPLLHLDALVAELGKFLQVEGAVIDVGSAGFEMTVSSARTIPSSDPVTIDSGTLDVILQPGDAGMDINGTRIVSKSGVLLGPGDIEKLQSVQTDGFPESNNSLLKAALVIIDKTALGTEQVTGVIDSLDSDSLFLVPDEGVSPVCGIATSLLEVALANNLDIFTVTITNDSSVITPGGTPGVDQTVGMNGKCVGTSYYTDNVVIIDDKR